MPHPASEIEKTVALAFTLLHGNPPKGVKHRGGMFSFITPAAQSYKRALQAYVRAELPEATRTNTLNARVRNRCLRYIMNIEVPE